MRARLVFGMIVIAGIEAWLPAAHSKPKPLRSKLVRFRARRRPKCGSPTADGREGYLRRHQKRVQYVVSDLGQQVGLKYNWRSRTGTPVRFACDPCTTS